VTSAPRLTLRMREVAAQTGASLTTVKGWVSSGRLTHARVGGVVLIKPADLERFIDRHLEGVDAAPLRAVPARRSSSAPAGAARPAGARPTRKPA